MCVTVSMCVAVRLLILTFVSLFHILILGDLYSILLFTCYIDRICQGGYDIASCVWGTPCKSEVSDIGSIPEML